MQIFKRIPAPMLLHLGLLFPLMLLSSRLGLAQSSLNNGQATISVTGYRALNDALAQAEQLLKFPINFEELPYQNAQDLSLVKPPGWVKPILAPLKHTLNVALTFTGPDAKANTDSAVQAILNTYQANHLPGLYKQVTETDSIDVVPDQILNRSGSMVSVTPVMDAHITFPYAKRSVEGTVELICDLVSQMSHTKVLLAFAPVSVAPGSMEHVEQVELQASDEPARTVLARLITTYGRPMSYKVLYEPDSQQYYFSIRGTAVNPTQSVNPESLKHTAVQTAPASVTDNPFFIKAK
jgi:hypothetical protein